MSKQIIIAEEHRIAAVVDDDQIQELIVATGTHQVGDIFLGSVENVLPSIDAAFVNIGEGERNGFIHVSDLGPLRLRKTAGSITELLAPQQRVLVQVMKEPTGTKGPRLTGNISLPGRYIVLMPYGRGVNLSRRIRSENERNRLRALAILIKPAGMGMVVRTEAEDIPEEAIIEDLEVLQKSWESTTEEALNSRFPGLLTRDDDFVQKVLRDAYSNDVNRIVVDSPTALKGVKQHLTSWGGGRLPQGVLVDHHRDRLSILEYFRVNAAIREALKPRVDLPSGGYIIIEKTEALTVIDVNSGSFTRSQTSRETVLWTNCESATEIARQLRLRNIAGVIVVDFIDMDSRRDQLQVLEHFNRAMQLDKAKPQIAQLTELGLVELTRKRQGKNIYELFGQTCAACSGIGLVAKLPGESTYQQIQAGFDRVPDAWEARRAESRRELPDQSSEGEGDDLELMHHPSYQERSGRGGRGTRRRRRGELPLPKDPVAPRLSPWEEESRYGAGGRTLPSVDAPAAYAPAEETALPRRIREERLERSESPDRGERLERPVRGERPERGERAERGERRDRGRGGRRDRFPVDPPEFIHVEMTADEQEVYSWMGISPLTLTAQEVKNPRNTYIAVTLPGEPAPVPPGPVAEPTPVAELTPAVAAGVAAVSTAATAILPAVTEPPIVLTSSSSEPIASLDALPIAKRLVRRRSVGSDPAAIDPSPMATPSIVAATPVVIPAATPAASPPPAPAPLPLLDEHDLEDEDDGTPLVRRRRRRSSAQ
jgi:ribonuclease E